MFVDPANPLAPSTKRSTARTVVAAMLEKYFMADDGRIGWYLLDVVVVVVREAGVEYPYIM